MISKRGRKCTVYWCECQCGKIKLVHRSNLTRHKNVGCHSCAIRLHPRKLTYFGEIPIMHFNSKKYSAEKRKMEFNLTLEYVNNLFLKQEKLCALSKLPIGFAVETRFNENVMMSRKIHTASLDRIDSNKGYIIGNVQWVHKDVNFMKQSYDQTYFIDICKRIAENNNG